MKFLFALFPTILLVFSNSALISSENPECSKDAEIIGFDYRKCGCCWGWIIKIEGDTIMADKLPDLEFTDKSRGKVKVELGEKSRSCYSKYPYHNIKCIKKLE